MAADSSSLEAEDGRGAEDCTSAEDGGGGGCGIVDCQQPEIVSEAFRCVVFASSYVAAAVECDDRKIVLVLVLGPLRVCVLVLIIPETEYMSSYGTSTYVPLFWSKTQRPC